MPEIVGVPVMVEVSVADRFLNVLEEGKAVLSESGCCRKDLAGGPREDGTGSDELIKTATRSRAIIGREQSGCMSWEIQEVFHRRLKLLVAISTPSWGRPGFGGAFLY